MRAIAAGLIIFISILGLYGEANACDCERPSLERSLEDSDVVFEGQVRRLTATGATFRITQQWKGIRDVEELEIATGPGTCSLSFREDELYLVFARQHGEQLRTNICDRTALMGDAEADLIELGPGVVPVDPGNDPEPELETPPAEDCAVVAPGASSGSSAPLFVLVFVQLMQRRRFL